MSENTGGTRIDTGADVFDNEGEKLGTVSYVVVRPPEMHVTDIVVSTGSILGRDILVPESEVDNVAGGRVYLSIDKAALDTHEDYVEVQYDQPPEDWVAPPGFLYPNGSILYPTGSYYPQASAVTVNAPSGTVGLHNGMAVESSDGHKIGSLDGVEETASGDDVTELYIKEGFLFTHDVRIPVSAIQATRADRITLNLTADQVREQFGR